MYVQAYKHARLMEESEWRVESAARSGAPDDFLVCRVLENPQLYRRWAAEHDRLLRAVSGERRIEAQVASAAHHRPQPCAQEGPVRLPAPEAADRA